MVTQIRDINETDNDWVRAANILYKNERDLLKNYRRKIDRSLVLMDKEQDWADLYFQSLSDLITSSEIWECMVPFAELYGTEGCNKRSQRHIKSSHECQAHYSGSHWNSRKGGDTKWFEPCNEYQPRGTNQFCGIFSMMHLLDRLPEKSAVRSFKKYYDYTLSALRFCKEVIRTCLEGKERKLYMDIVEVALENYPALINIIEFPLH